MELHPDKCEILQGSYISMKYIYSLVLHLHWWKGVATLPWGARDCQQSWHSHCWLNTLYTSHCQLPDMVWSLQQVAVWPSTEEETCARILYLRLRYSAIFKQTPHWKSYYLQTLQKKI